MTLEYSCRLEISVFPLLFHQFNQFHPLFSSLPSTYSLLYYYYLYTLLFFITYSLLFNNKKTLTVCDLFSIYCSLPLSLPLHTFHIKVQTIEHVASQTPLSGEISKTDV